MAEAATEPASAEDDRRLVRRVLDGDREAFALLVRAQQSHVERIVGGFFRRADVIEEVAQEVFVKAYQSLAEYRGGVPFAHWLSRIAVNACYDQLRRQRRSREVAVSQLGDDPPGFWERLTAPEAFGEDEFWRREETRLTAERVLAMLSPAERLVLTLMVLEERSAAEVARLTGWSVANVKVRAFRARRRLRRILAAAQWKGGKR